MVKIHVRSHGLPGAATDVVLPSHEVANKESPVPCDMSVQDGQETSQDHFDDF